MTIQLTAFKARKSGYDDHRTGDFALAFEVKSRRAPFFGNILVDALWATWMPHAEFPATPHNANVVLAGDDSPYPDSAMMFFKAEDAEYTKAALASLMTTWAEGKSTVLGYGEEQAIALAYRDMGPAGLFVFLYCSYMEPDSIHAAFKSVGIPKRMYKLVQTEEERSGNDFLSSMRDNDPKWFKTLQRVGVIDSECVVLDEVDEDD